MIKTGGSEDSNIYGVVIQKLDSKFDIYLGSISNSRRAFYITIRSQRRFNAYLIFSRGKYKMDLSSSLLYII